jgi:hypothetical protein
MSAYLANNATRAILFSPIKTNILDGFRQLNAHLAGCFDAAELAALGDTDIENIAAKLQVLE